nr:hypothetical protein [Candidatus Baldrarchaeota archaeon]
MWSFIVLRSMWKLEIRLSIFLLPGDDLIDVVDRFWKTGAAGPRFRKMFKSMVPFSRYDYVIIDTAPFFDPRYITLS